MKKIVPLRKDLNFKTSIAEITSIALDHEFNLEEHVIKGNLIISGSYRINDVSVNTEEFKYNIPVNIEMNDKYILDNVKTTVEDFYYEIVNNNVLTINIEIGIDNLEEKLLNPIKYEEEKIEKVIKTNDDNIEKVEIKENRNINNDVKSLFSNFDDSKESFTTYKICIVSENDTIDSISIKYGITKEILQQYNDLSDIKIGDKLIIPALSNETN